MLLPYVLLILILFSPAVAAGQNITGNLEVHYIDVGQGDAALVMTPNRECVMLIDSGGDSFYPSSAKMFRDYLTKILPLGHKIDLVVSSHPHSDHIGTMLWALQKYKVKTYIDNGHQRPRVNDNGNKTVYGKLMDEIDHQIAEHGLKYFAHNEATTSSQDFCFQAANLDSELISPSTGYPAAVCDSNPNNCSVLVKIRYANTTFLFVGDAEHEQEQILVQDETSKPRLKAQVLKAPHHGSDTSSTIAFLEAVSPEWIVIS